MTDIGMILVTVLAFLLMYFFVNWCRIKLIKDSGGNSDVVINNYNCAISGLFSLRTYQSRKILIWGNCYVTNCMYITYFFNYYVSIWKL